MQADLKSLMRTHLGQLADETATLAALRDCMTSTAEERRRTLGAFQRWTRAVRPMATAIDRNDAASS
jgi:hypothetical protein